MLTKRWMTGLLGVVCSWCVVACAGDAGKEPAPSGPPGRGSAACQKWQGAFCDWAAKCGSAPRSACDPQAKSIICKADDVASSCASNLASASCTTPPAGCDSADLADTAAATSMCQTYLESACDALLRCNIKSDKNACVMELASMQDCSKVVGVALGYETCISDLANGACDKLLPMSCNGVFFATR